MKVVAVIPALDEAATVAEVVLGVPADLASAVVLVDGGSRDGTPERAREAGAVVVVEHRRGYGRACRTGVERAMELGAEVIAFLDASGASDSSDLRSVLAPVITGRADFVIGSRVLGLEEAGALRPVQRAGNRLATELIRLRFGHRYTDLGSMRAIRADALARLAMREEGSGWPVEMQLRALVAGLRVEEVPLRYRKRRAGRSKVSGSLRGSIRAGVDILRVVLGAP